MTTSFNEENFIKKLESVVPTQDCIQSIALWIIHHKNNHELITKLWLDKVKTTETPKQILTLFFLANDIIQNCKRKNAKIFQESFKIPVLEGVKYAKDETIRFSIQRIFNVWLDRNVYDKEYIDKLTDELNNGSPIKRLELPTKKQEESKQTPQKVNEPVADDIEIDPKIQQVIAEFQPKKLFEKINRFVQMEKDILAKKNLIETSRLLEINIDHIKQYRDKVQCEKFINEFDNSCIKLDEYIRNLETQSTERESLIQLLEQSEIFYNAQFKDAKLIVNAYGSFAQKVETLKRKLEETLETMNKRPSDVKLDNLDMDLSDDDGDKSPIMSYSSKLKRSHESIPRLQSVVTAVKPQSNSSGIKNHLDPRQNRLQQSNSAQNFQNKYQNDSDIRGENNKNPLDFLTKIINKSSTVPNNISTPNLNPANNSTNSSLINSLQTYIEKSHQQQQPTRKNSTENYYDPREYNYDGFYDSNHDEHLNSKRPRANPFLTSAKQFQREGTPTKDEIYQKHDQSTSLPQTPSTSSIYQPNQAYNPFTMIPPQTAITSHQDPMLSGMAYYPTPIPPPPPPPPHAYVPYPPPPPVPHPHHNPFTAQYTNEEYQSRSHQHDNSNKRRYSDNNTRFQPSSSNQSRHQQNFTSPHKHHNQQQNQKFNRIPTVSSQRDRYDDNLNNNGNAHHYGRSNSRY